MSDRVYLNRREGRFKEWGVLAVLLLGVGALVAFAVFQWKGMNESGRSAKGLRVVTAQEGREDSAERQQSSAEKHVPVKVAACWKAVVESPYVKANSLYETVLRNVTVLCQDDNNQINAFATWKEERQVRQPVVVVLGGLVRLADVYSRAIAADRLHVTTNAVKRLVAQFNDEFSTLSPVQAKVLSANCRLPTESDGARFVAVQKEAAKLFGGMLMGTLAHEAGHIAYGHGHATEPVRRNLDISRNQERDADSFCSSVMASSEYGAYVFESMLFFNAILARTESGKAGSHPLSKERLANLIRANERLAREKGLLKKSDNPPTE